MNHISSDTTVSVRLERGEAVRWHDGTQWQVGVVLRHVAIPYGRWYVMALECVLVQTVAGIYVVECDKLEPYGPRCEECGGEGQFDSGGSREDGSWINVPCPACRGSGRKG